MKKESPNLQKVLEFSFIGLPGLPIFEVITVVRRDGSAWATEIRGH
jgi:hypothetical protein